MNLDLLFSEFQSVCWFVWNCLFRVVEFQVATLFWLLLQLLGESHMYDWFEVL